MIQEEEEYFTTKELAERWKKSIFTIRRMARDRKIPKMRLGREFRFRLSDILEYENFRYTGKKNY